MSKDTLPTSDCLEVGKSKEKKRAQESLSSSFGPRRRVKKRSDFLEIQSQGRKRHSDHFLVAWRRAETSEKRLGITVTKKVHKRAVKRNFLKRQIREFFRTNRRNFGKKVDLVVIAKRGACSLSGPEVQAEIASLFKAAGFFSKPRDRRPIKKTTHKS